MFINKYSTNCHILSGLPNSFFADKSIGNLHFREVSKLHSVSHTEWSRIKKDLLIGVKLPQKTFKSMKKLVVIFVLCFLVSSFGIKAQIKVSSTGFVGINQATPAYNLDWYGTGRYWSSYGDLIFDNTGWGGVATIHPGTDWAGCLGTSTKKFNLLYVDHVIARDLEETSDETVKTNIKPLGNALEKILKLRGVTYDIKSEYFNTADAKIKASLEKNGKGEIGFLAQELKEVFPEVVFFDETSNLYSVSYTRLVPILVEAMKAQQLQIDELKNLISKK